MALACKKSCGSSYGKYDDHDDSDGMSLVSFS